MKIYTKIVLDKKSNVIEEESFEYSGPVALCKGGSSSSVDKAYNRGLLAIQQEQQAQAEKYFDFWESAQQPLERAQIQANMGLIPAQVGAERAQLALDTGRANTAASLLEDEKAFRQAELGYGTERMAADLRMLPQTELASKNLLTLANKGTDVMAAGNRAGADVSREFAKAGGMTARNALLNGVDPNSSTFARGMGGLAADRARAVGTARTGGRIDAEQRNISNLSNALNTVKR